MTGVFAAVFAHHGHISKEEAKKMLLESIESEVRSEFDVGEN